MDWLHHLLWRDDKFLGIVWSVWKVVGWAGNAIFSTRFLVQWYATERRQQVVIPPLFWWLSLTGSLLLLAYGLFYLHDSVVIFAYAFSWIPYIRNLLIHRRHELAQIVCPGCQERSQRTAHYCSQCGAKLPKSTAVE